MNERIRIPLTGFQHRSFPFWGELKQPSWVLPTSCFPTAVKLWRSIKYSRKLTVLSHSSRAACHLGIENLGRVLKKDQIFKSLFCISRLAIPKWAAARGECDNKLQSWTKVVETNEYHTFVKNVLTYKRVRNILSPLSPAQYCFLGFAIHPTLFWQRYNIDNIDVGEGGWKH